jgi:branched-subunit amino acid aminotransferase/4-amino-4-deoxychorismate lyase
VVYLKKNGELLDASTSNICLIQDSVLYASVPGPGVLKGLYLERFLQVAQDLGYTVERRNLYQADVESADSLLLTNCLKGVRLAEGIEKSYDDSLLWKARIDEIERLMHE